MLFGRIKTSTWGFWGGRASPPRHTFPLNPPLHVNDISKTRFFAKILPFFFIFVLNEIWRNDKYNVGLIADGCRASLTANIDGRQISLTAQSDSFGNDWLQFLQQRVDTLNNILINVLTTV